MVPSNRIENKSLLDTFTQIYLDKKMLILKHLCKKDIIEASSYSMLSRHVAAAVRVCNIKGACQHRTILHA